MFGIIIVVLYVVDILFTIIFAVVVVVVVVFVLVPTLVVLIVIVQQLSQQLYTSGCRYRSVKWLEKSATSHSLANLLVNKDNTRLFWPVQRSN